MKSNGEQIAKILCSFARQSKTVMYNIASNLECKLDCKRRRLKLRTVLSFQPEYLI